ncbi:hypothetical protein [Pseudomonas putida]|uniref:hypothetical protein n=1 Tax=Pseudomonas putida TaxID=303 RepID=UPI0011A2E717|nr:hypothetical protein [Pseudomonas putida]
MKSNLLLLAVAMSIGGCSTQLPKPDMQESQYKAIAQASAIADGCAVAGLIDLNLAAAGSRMLDGRAAEFTYDPAKLKSETSLAAQSAQQNGNIHQSACNAFAYEVVKVQQVQKNAADEDQERRRLALQMLMRQQGSSTAQPASALPSTTVCNTYGNQTVCNQR